MSKVKVSRAEIERMLKDQLDCKNIKWDKDGNCLVDLDFEQLKKGKEIVKEIIREPYIYPVPYKPWYPEKYYWTVNKNTMTLSYSSTK